MSVDNHGGANMINAVNLLKRRPDISVDEFQRHWRHEHANVIARLPGVQRYVQLHPIPAEYERGEPVCDGIAELWARDSRAFRVIGGSEAYAAVQADEEHFLDRTAIVLVLTQEHAIKDGPVAEDGIRCVRFFRRKTGLAVEAFQSYWREEYGPRFAALPSLDRYSQYHARPGGYAKGRQPAYDGFDVTWFGSVEALHDAMNSDAYRRAFRDHELFLAGAECPQLLVREHILIS